MTRIFDFFRGVRAELTKVVWPSRQDTLRYTIAIIAFSVVIAAILGAADYGLLKLFEVILNR